MSAPLVINLRDGSVWERRAVTRDGVARYALAGSCRCPEYLLASESELAAQGIAGSADVLPVPVGPEPLLLSAERLAEIEKFRDQCHPVTGVLAVGRVHRALDDLLVEVGRLRAERCSTNESLDDAVQELRALREDEPAEAQPLMVFRASHDSIAMGLYTTAAEARRHCEEEERRTWTPSQGPTHFAWIEDEEDGVAEMTVWVGGDECATDYVVTGLEVASEYDAEADE